MSMMAWQYVKLVNNRLVDSEYGGDVNVNFPNFYSVQEAEAYLLEHDIRATVIGEGQEEKTFIIRWSGSISWLGNTVEEAIEDFKTNKDFARFIKDFSVFEESKW